MALIKCKDCGADVSKSAKTCPQCGAKMPAKTSTFTILVALLIAFGAYISLTTPSAPPAPPVQKTSAQLAAEKKEADDFQRAVMALRLVRNNMKNPASFSPTLVGITAAGAICIEYRATNAFNAIVPGRFVVAGTSSGDSAAAWNQHCANKSVTNFTHAQRAM